MDNVLKLNGYTIEWTQELEDNLREEFGINTRAELERIIGRQPIGSEDEWPPQMQADVAALLEGRKMPAPN